MKIIKDKKTQIVGFGETSEEAAYSLHYNMARRNLDNDVTGIYRERHEILHPWQPLPNMLQICGVGNITRTGNIFTNTRTGVSLPMSSDPMSHYITLYFLLDGQLSFDDFSVSIAREVDTFLGDGFDSLDDFPYFKPVDLRNLTAMHCVTDDISVAETSMRTLIFTRNRKSLEIDLVDSIDPQSLLAYGLARLGVLYNGKEFKEIL